MTEHEKREARIADSLECIERQLERIADSLERNESHNVLVKIAAAIECLDVHINKTGEEKK